MAWLFKRPNSPYWYIGYRKDTKKPAESTRLRYDDPAQTREANDKLREANARELAGAIHSQQFRAWVPQFLALRYGGNPANLKSYSNRWKALDTFLASRRVLFPKDVTGEHAWQYILWRTGAAKREGGTRRARKNTALEELKLFRMLMRHAIALGYSSRNPIEAVRVPWDDPKEKPEIEPEHLPLILKALKAEPAWMDTMFRIAFYTGCRLHDSRVLLRYVDLDRKLIHFPEAKGKKPFTVPIPPPLLALFTELKRDTARQWAFDPDCPMRVTSVRWIHFFRKIGLSQYSFHCTRVSFITRCIRAGLPETVTLRLVNHCSVLIHRLYQRFRAEDLRAAVESIPHPELDPSGTQDACDANAEPLSSPDTERPPSP